MGSPAHFRRLFRRALHVSSWHLPTSPGGTLKVRLPTTSTVRIHALNPHNSTWDEARINLEVLGETDDSFVSEETARQVVSAMQVSVTSDFEPGRNFVLLEAPPESTGTSFSRSIHRLRAWLGGPFRGHRPLFDCRVVFDVFIPGKFDLDVEMAGGKVDVRNVFEGDVRILSEGADVKVAKLKSMYIDVDCNEGDFSAATLQGNVSIRSGSGQVDIGRVQGPSVRCVTTKGHIQTRALYADYAMLQTREGTVRLGGAQGYVKVRTVEGGVEANGVEGRFDVETDRGDVEVNLSVPRVVSIRSRCGDVCLGIPAKMGGGVLLQGGESVKVEDGSLEGVEGREEGGVVKCEGQGEGVTVHARAPRGDVVVRKSAWGGLWTSREGEREQFPRWVAS